MPVARWKPASSVLGFGKKMGRIEVLPEFASNQPLVDELVVVMMGKRPEQTCIGRIGASFPSDNIPFPTSLPNRPPLLEICTDCRAVSSFIHPAS